MPASLCGRDLWSTLYRIYRDESQIFLVYRLLIPVLTTVSDVFCVL